MKIKLKNITYSELLGIRTVVPNEKVESVTVQALEKKTAIHDLLNWTPEGVPLKKISRLHYPESAFPRKEYGEICTDEDCKAPFFSEAYLYNLLGKEDARTLMALLQKALGVRDLGEARERREI